MSKLVYFTGDIALADNLRIEECMAIQELLKKLHDYEIAEEQGLLLKLPCKVGDTVHMLHRGKYQGVRVVEGFEFHEGKIQGLDKCKCHIGTFGKDLFLTKEEAEQKLAEM